MYEPKFDGWRAVVFAALGVVQSRRNNDLAARFPEIVAAARALGDVVVDGELVALREGRLDFGSLAVMPRARAAAGVEVYFIAFDLLAVGDDDVRGTPLPVRRARLEKVFAEARPPLQLTPSIQDRAATELWMRSESAEVGIEGVVAKKFDSRYRAGRTGDWVKVRQRVVVDAVVVGVAGPLTRPEALLLARPDAEGVLLPIGLSLPLPPMFRDEAARYVTPTGEPRRRLPTTVLGQEGSEYVPVHPTLVVEAEAEATVMTFTARLRPRIHRFRTDLTPTDLRPLVE
ncbi:ATP-dependent DNA ligase [Actinophytocola algeriensis]|uniref:ATP-dependent DNA ligase n=1 Tax=Actinophytocola algeriensis TaxID=1768010 RepID=A0A7W7QDB1_9PSEU|nr:ATP-dependent DNA ligase [Actinophytocola algeriensis]MBB4911497.1 ATP-dependent DNA ligase [Actinophytocola algeriensis]MBE1473515.1 ATP-dependent DNA ligase [Actinophytocola algeriensis]